MIPSDNFDSARKNKGGYIVKLFGKKTLALLLALSMVMSVCVFAGETVTLAVGGTTNLAVSVEGATGISWSSSSSEIASVSNGTVTGVAAGTATITANYTVGEGESATSGTAEWTVTVQNVAVESVSVDASKTIVVGKTATLTPTVAPANATNKNVTWSSDNTAVATVSNGTVTAVSVGTANITVTTVDGSKTATCAVEVTKASIKSASTTTSAVPYGASETVVKKKLPNSVEVTLADNSKATLNSTYLESWTGIYNETATSHVYTANLKSNNNYELQSGVQIQVTVPTTKTWSLSQITMSAVIEGDDDTVPGLDEEIEYAIETTLGKSVSSSSISYDFTSGYYGAVGDTTGTYTVNLTDSEEEKLYEDGYLTDTINYKATCGGVEYTGSIKLTMYTTDVSATFTYAGGTLASIASRIDSMMGGKMEAIEFEELDLEGGVLWADDNYDEEVYEGEYYTPSELADMIYLPNGSGETSYLSYVAYDDYDDDDDEVDDDADYIEGTIMLYADEFLLLTAEITSEEVVDLDGATFEDAFLDLDSDYEYLDYVTFTKPASSDGYLYVEYDEDDNKHTSIGSSTKYYVEDDDKALIDDITYVPGKNTEGVVTIKFKAIGYDDDEDKVTVNGVMQITVTVAADITVQAGKGQEVALDYDLFEEYFEDNVSSTYDDYIITAVVFNGVPHSKNAGYLYLDDEKLTDPDGDKFWFDPDDEDEENLFDLLTYVGGNKDTTTRGEFSIYGKKNANAKDSTSKKLVSGTIDFVTGAAAAGNTMNGTLQASKTMSFGETVTLNAFKALGGNDNEYVTFSALPVGGKLVYNWGLPTQEDVKVGTEYYLSYKAGKKLMQNVTFVPGYSSVKTQKTITIGVTGVNAKGRTTMGTINITVNYAAYSSKFYDITNSTYADSVDFLVNQGITKGMTDTTFGPNNNVTRAQFVTFLWRAAGQPTVTGVTNKFTDVKSTGTYDYAYQAILWAVQNGITQGRSATSFAPGATVTYQEIMQFLYNYDVNYLKHPDTQGNPSYIYDYAQVTWGKEAVNWAVYKQIFTSGYLKPNTAGTRADVALYLHRMLTL